MEETIPVLYAVQQEVRLRKSIQLVLLCCGIVPILVVVGSIFGVQAPVAFLGIMLVVYFYVSNKKEIDRLREKYERK